MSDHKHTPLSDQILGKIEQEHIAPKPKWHFLLHEWVVWFVAFAALVVGSIAATLSFYIADASRFIVRHIQLSDLHALFAAIPVLWLVLLSIGIFYTVHAVHSTRKGYKWHSSWLVGSALLTSVVFGWGAHTVGLGGSIDRYLLEEVALYKPLTGFEPMNYMDQTQGIVAGVVEEVYEESFIVRKIDGDLLEVSVATSTVVHLHERLKEGMPIHVVGTTTADEEVFEAQMIGAFRGRGGGHMRGMMFRSEGGSDDGVKEKREGMRRNR